MSLLDWQRQFAGHLLADDAVDGRMAIYRRNVRGSLTETVAMAFPVTRHLLGAARFAGLAGRFVLDHPPAEAALWRYGDGFVDFLELNAAPGDPAWTVDLARLELASARAAVAVDMPSVAPQALAQLDHRLLAGLTLTLHPSLAVVASPWDLAAAWRSWREDRPPTPPQPAGEGSAILVARLDGEVVHRPLNPWQSRLLQAWIGGAGLEAAVIAADTDADAVQGELAFLLRHGLCVGFAVEAAPDAGGQPPLMPGERP